MAFTVPVALGLANGDCNMVTVGIGEPVSCDDSLMLVVGVTARAGAERAQSGPGRSSERQRPHTAVKHNTNPVLSPPSGFETVLSSNRLECQQYGCMVSQCQQLQLTSTRT
jgi:hypothetical protein